MNIYIYIYKQADIQPDRQIYKKSKQIGRG